MNHQARKKPIPEFKSLEEEAKFWDTHSFADYWQGWKKDKIHFTKKLTDNINVRFEPAQLAKIREAAQKKGIGPTTLIRMWVLEHLHSAT